MKEFSNFIVAYALKNAIEFGKVDASKILPKLFQHGLDKKDIAEIMPKIQEAVKKVNSTSQNERIEIFKSFSQFIKEREIEERKLPELPNVSDKMVFRLAPFPSGALHLGNAKTYLLNALYAEKYKAKTLLVMDDTIGSEEKQPLKEAYKLIEEGFKWLGVSWEKPIFYKSDRLEIYYNYAEQLIRKYKAYVCHCTQEELRANRANAVECGCRQFPADVQMERWKQMFTDKEGDAVLRIKTSMQDPNPAFRDRVLFKISDREHPRVGKKYRVWPTLEMSWAVDDHELGVTHIIRGNDLAIESDMEKFIWDIFGWKHPTLIHVALVRMEGIGGKLSKSKAQKEVKSGEFSGWEDPRTWSLQSLRRRGILPESIREFVEEIGVNRQDITVPIENLYAINRKAIDANALRYSFVANPIKLGIEGKPDMEVIDVPVHPDKKETREIKIKDLFISKEDFEGFKGEETRLIHLFNLKIGKICEVTSVDNKNIPKIQWVSENVKTRVLMPSGEWISGISDSAVSKIKIGEIIQFERFGFVRLDRKVKEGNEDVWEFWFTHK